MKAICGLPRSPLSTDGSYSIASSHNKNGEKKYGWPLEGQSAKMVHKQQAQVREGGTNTVDAIEASCDERIDPFAGGPHESCYHDLDLRDRVHAFVCDCRATPLLPITCPFLDHHLDALTELVGAPKLAFAPLLLLALLLHLKDLYVSLSPSIPILKRPTPLSAASKRKTIPLSEHFPNLCGMWACMMALPTPVAAALVSSTVPASASVTTADTPVRNGPAPPEDRTAQFTLPGMLRAKLVAIQLLHKGLRPGS